MGSKNAPWEQHKNGDTLAHRLSPMRLHKGHRLRSLAMAPGFSIFASAQDVGPDIVCLPIRCAPDWPAKLGGLGSSGAKRRVSK
jgi:hypothetical protein